MIIEKEYTINRSLQLIDLNQEFINFVATFDVKASKLDDKFMLCIVDEEQLEDEDSIKFQNIVGHIDGDISNNNDHYKNFYIALKSMNEINITVKITVDDINVIDNDIIDNTNNNDLNANNINENNTMVEEPQRTNLNEIFDQEPKDTEVQNKQPSRRRRKKKRVEVQPDEDEMRHHHDMNTNMDGIQHGRHDDEDHHHHHHQQQHQEEEEEEEEEQTILSNIIKYKYIIFGVCVVLLGYYYITYVDPLLYDKLCKVIPYMSKKSSPPCSSPPSAPIMKTPVDLFTEKLANLQV